VSKEISSTSHWIRWITLGQHREIGTFGHVERFSGLNRHWPGQIAKVVASAAAGQLSCCCALVVDVMLIFCVLPTNGDFYGQAASFWRQHRNQQQLQGAASQSRKLANATCDCREQLIFKSGQVQLHWLESFYFLILCFSTNSYSRRNLAICPECSASLAFNGNRRFLWRGRSPSWHPRQWCTCPAIPETTHEGS